jgi:HSP20 family protein
LDVVETTGSVEVVVDVPGVAAESLRVAVRRSTLLVGGAKLAPPAEGSVRFHVAERSYGRFARAVRIAGAFDSRKARATARDGQLRSVFPRLADRRGEVMLIPVNTP